jgi:RNA polymerase sigma-70 factor (ECF subfamily)
MDISRYPDLSDTELVHLCQVRGAVDDRPFTALFHRHRIKIWRICYRFTGNAADADDLTQEVFFKAYRGLPAFESRSSFKTWLHRIAINACQNELRKRRRQPPLAETPMEDFEETLTGEPLRNGAGEKALIWQQVNQLLVSVREEDREALYLRDVEERPFSEIAETLGISLSAAKMRVYRTRLEIQKAYTMLEKEETA